LSLSVFDIDLRRFYNYNNYEHSRVGAGLQTNERLLKWLSVGGWAGYGFGDHQWKYGAFAEVYADRNKEFVFHAGYADDITDPGRVRLHRELDKNYLRYYLLQRVDRTKTWTGSVSKKLGYWSVEVAGRQQEIIPQYTYALENKGNDIMAFNAKEAALSFRYAFAERTAPFFGKYYSMGSRYPIVYGKVTAGYLEGTGMPQMQYTQALAAVAWHKHINRVGYEHILVEAGQSWSESSLPLSKLFAGNGLKYIGNREWSRAIYSFGGMVTMLPYEYYSDRFINVFFRHDIDRKLYRWRISKGLSSAPNICLQYNMLYGELNNRAAHKYVNFAVPDNAYHEAGLLVNSIARLVYLNLYYLTLNVGYFYHITPAFDAKANGRFVYGVGIEF
jgi:hypothetical protein